MRFRELIIVYLEVRSKPVHILYGEMRSFLNIKPLDTYYILHLFIVPTNAQLQVKRYIVNKALVPNATVFKFYVRISLEMVQVRIATGVTRVV
jgi:hypothetical protein